MLALTLTLTLTLTKTEGLPRLYGWLCLLPIWSRGDECLFIVARIDIEFQPKRPKEPRPLKKNLRKDYFPPCLENPGPLNEEKCSMRCVNFAVMLLWASHASALALVIKQEQRSRPWCTSRSICTPTSARRTMTMKAADSKSWVAPSGPAPMLGRLYSVAGVASAVSWTACATYCLSQHPSLTLPMRHNILTIAQALAFPVPITLAFGGALSAAASTDMSRLAGPTYRRLNLGFATASLWLAAVAAKQASKLSSFPSPFAFILNRRVLTPLRCLPACLPACLPRSVRSLRRFSYQLHSCPTRRS